MNLFYGHDLKRIEVLPCAKLDLRDLCLKLASGNWALNILCPGITITYMGNENSYRKITHGISPRIGVLPELTGDITMNAESLQGELSLQENEIYWDAFLVRLHEDEI